MNLSHQNIANFSEQTKNRHNMHTPSQKSESTKPKINENLTERGGEGKIVCGDGAGSGARLGRLRCVTVNMRGCQDACDQGRRPGGHFRSRSLRPRPASHLPGGTARGAAPPNGSFRWRASWLALKRRCALGAGAGSLAGRPHPRK